MLKIFKYEENDRFLDVLLVTIAKLMVVLLMWAFAFCLAFASTIGPTIAKGSRIGSIEVDMIVRIGLLLTAVVIALAVVLWFVVPLIYFISKKLFAK